MLGGVIFELAVAPTTAANVIGPRIGIDYAASKLLQPYDTTIVGGNLSLDGGRLALAVGRDGDDRHEISFAGRQAGDDGAGHVPEVNRIGRGCVGITIGHEVVGHPGRGAGSPIQGNGIGGPRWDLLQICRRQDNDGRNLQPEEPGAVRHRRQKRLGGSIARDHGIVVGPDADSKIGG